ncbi:MAG: rhomboid family intramembrane serine protease [Gemmatimonadaceae bacterium]
MTQWVRNLLVLNVLVYFVQMTMPGLVDALAFVPVDVFIKPWTLITYMFLHGSLTHIAFNMLALYFFGPRVEERLGSRSFVTMYFIAGISGAILSFFLARSSPIIGASAGVFGVMLAFAYFWPDAPIYIWGVLPVPARILVILTTAFSLYSGLRGSRGGIADFAHLGGYAGAFLYLKWLERRSGTRRFKTQMAASPPQAREALNRWKSIDTRNIHEVNRAEVNRILDKINVSGLGSLSPQEQTFLSNFVPPDDRIPPVT